MKYSDKEMAALIREVEDQFKVYLAKTEQEPKSDLNKSEEANNTETETVEVSASENEASMNKSEDEFDYDEEDYQEMDKLYKSMSKSEAEAHYKSVKKALFGTEEIENQIQKSETVETEEESNDNELIKSEIAVVKKENEELKKNLNQLTSALHKFVTKPAPKRKAVTKIEYIKKSEDETTDVKEIDVTKLDKKEISSRLSAKIREGELKKSDREAIDKYYLDQNAKKSIDLIKHLL